MFSLQTIFGKGDKFYGLLEASADAARDSAAALVRMFQARPQAPSLDEFMLARKREKDLSAQISQELVNTFVTALDREDIEALSAALNKITKSISKFAERYALAADRLGDIDFTTRAALLEKAGEVIAQMVAQLRKGMNLETMKSLNDRLQSIENEADRLLLDLYRDLYSGRHEAIRILLLKDLFELLEKAIDRCRDAGNVVYQIVLKNS
ncbi:MAG TPA: pit accessory protein [Dokdonella sp.]